VERGDEFFWGDTRLFQDTMQGSNLDLTVKRYHAPTVGAAHDNVAATLTDGNETQAVKNFDALAATDAWQLRHHRPR
jgi:hypothetical protein